MMVGLATIHRLCVIFQNIVVLARVFWGALLLHPLSGSCPEKRPAPGVGPAVAEAALTVAMPWLVPDNLRITIYTRNLLGWLRLGWLKIT